MPVVNGSVDDHVDVTAVENFAVIAGGEQLITPELFGSFKSSCVQICRGDNFHPGDSERRLYVTDAHTARTNEPNADLVIGRPDGLHLYSFQITYLCLSCRGRQG